MSLSFFDDKAVRPDEEALAAALGPALANWEAVRAWVYACDKPSDDWKYYGKSAGWTYKLFSGKRNLVFLVPQEGVFKAYFILGERAAAAALACGLPDEIRKLIEDATVHVEGRSFQFDINGAADVDTALKLLEIKRKN